MTILFLAIFIFLMFIGIPIAFVIAIVALLGIMTIPNIPNLTVASALVTGLDSFVLLAIPLFILVANLMNSGKISEKLIELAMALVGPIRGGLAHANILVSMMFAGVSGSAQADTAGVGKILIPSMESQGYDRETAVAVTAASSTIGVIIPPSIPVIIYAGIANASVGALFLGGVIPGMLIGLGMMTYIYFRALRRDYPKQKLIEIKKFIKLVIETAPALFTVIIIIGGILFGFFTATEAAAIASLYTLVVSMFFYRTIKLKDLPAIFMDTLALSSLSLFALAAATALGELLSYYQLSQVTEQFFKDYVNSKILFILIAIAFFLFIGTFMDAIPAMILFVPVILPTAISFGIDPVHLGLIIVITLAMGLVTPPYGLCLLLAAKIGDLTIEKSFLAVIPYLIISLLILLLLAFIPEIAFYVPRLINPHLF